MSKQVIHELAIATQQGKLTFPQVVKGLLEVGVESYLVDFAAKQKTHYLTDGTTHTVPMILDPGRVVCAPRLRGTRPDSCPPARAHDRDDHGRSYAAC